MKIAPIPIATADLGSDGGVVDGCARGEPTEGLLSQWQDVVAHEGEGAREEEGGKEFLLSAEFPP